jgi:hypothetical protein
MQRPPVIRIDNTLARTAFALQPHLICQNKKWLLELRRTGIEKAICTLTPLEIDSDNRLVFDWGNRLRQLKPGLYTARLLANGTQQDEVLLQLSHHAKVTHAEVITIDCCEAIDECRPACDEKPVYVPSYTVPLRNC